MCVIFNVYKSGGVWAKPAKIKSEKDRVTFMFASVDIDNVSKNALYLSYVDAVHRFKFQSGCFIFTRNGIDYRYAMRLDCKKRRGRLYGYVYQVYDDEHKPVRFIRTETDGTHTYFIIDTAALRRIATLLESMANYLELRKEYDRRHREKR